MSNIEQIIAQLETDRSAIDKAITALRDISGAAARGRTAPAAVAAAATVAGPRKKRRLSAAGRQRIAEAARRRWAAIKKAKSAGK